MFWAWPDVLESTHSEVEYEHKFYMFSIEIVRVIFSFEYVPPRSRNKDSSYGPMEGRKNCSLTFSTRFWLGNIFPISRDQCSRNQILLKKYVSGKLFTSSNHLENTLKSDLRSPFRQELVNGKDVMGVA